jgi:hypothetical protein
MSFTTIKINSGDLSWWKDCCKKFKMSSSEVFSEFKKKAMAKKQNEFFCHYQM